MVRSISVAGSEFLVVKGVAVPPWGMRLLYALARFYWRLTRPVQLGVKGIVIDDGRVLLVRTTYGDRRWDFPGGHVQRGESAAAAVVREIREETGARVTQPILLGLDYVTDHKHDHVAVFVCRLQSVGEPTRNAEIAESGFYPIDSPPVVRESTERWLAARPLEVT